MPGKSKDRVRKGRVTTCSLCGAVGHRLETCSLPGASEFRRLRKESRAKPRFADKNNKERNAPNKHGSHAKMARKAYSRNPAKTRGRNPRRVIPRGLTLSGIETDAEALEWLLRKKFLKRPAACPDCGFSFQAEAFAKKLPSGKDWCHWRCSHWECQRQVSYTYGSCFEGLRKGPLLLAKMLVHYCSLTALVTCFLSFGPANPKP